MPQKIEIQDVDHVLIDGSFVGDIGRAFIGLASTPGAHVAIAKAFRDWHQSLLDGHQGDNKARADQHAAQVAALQQQLADATAQAEADRAAEVARVAAEVEAQRKAHEDWQAAQDAERAKRQAEHEAALKDLAESHRATTEHLEVELQQSQATLAQIADALKELGDIPAVLALARERRAEKLRAELEALEAQAGDQPRMMARGAMAAPATGFSDLYRATDGRKNPIARVIYQSDPPGVIHYWEIDDVAHANDPIGKVKKRMTLDAWREAGFQPYTPGDEP